MKMCAYIQSQHFKTRRDPNCWIFLENQRIWPAWAHISTDNCRLGPSSSLALREAWGRQFTLASHVPAVQVWGPWALAFSLWPRPEPLFASLWFLHTLLEFHQPPPSPSPFKQGFHRLRRNRSDKQGVLYWSYVSRPGSPTWLPKCLSK